MEKDSGFVRGAYAVVLAFVLGGLARLDDAVFIGAGFLADVGQLAVAVEQRKVLVVHPFVDTIRSQYQKRELLFSNPDVLPEFELKTLKAVQTIAGTKSEFASWFDALKYMEDEIDKIDFDIAIIGCGAYGLPLAAHVKRIGKQAVHIAGGTQLLFGILGKRWTEQYQGFWHYRPGIDISLNYHPLFNEYWVSPSRHEKPKGSEKVEGGCYW